MPLALAVVALFMVTATGRTVPSMAIVLGAVRTHDRGGFMSINSAFQQLACGLGAMLAGGIIHKTTSQHYQHFEWVGLIAIAAAGACVVLARWLR
jgi:predicted MFS family arabinose efflux permease